MNMSFRLVAGSVGAFMAMAMHAPSAAAEWNVQRVVQSPTGSRAAGWVGLQVDFIARSATEAQTGRYTVVISDVDPEGPAWAAGVQPGDTLTSINGSPASPKSFQALRKGLRIGDPIALGIRRDTGGRDVSMVAAARPSLAVGNAPASMVVRIDSLRTVILRNADSLRRRWGADHIVVQGQVMTTSDDSLITVLEVSKGQSVTLSVGNVTVRSSGSSPQGSWTFQYEEPGTPEPFESRIVSTPRTDSLRAVMERLQEQLELVARAENRRTRDLVRVADATRADAARADEQLARLESVRRIILAEIKGAEAQLRDASRARLKAEPAAPWVAGSSVGPLRPPSSVRLDAPASVGTAITTYVVGRNYLAGAEVATLNSRLASYFEVERGILVTDVAPQTPADVAGLVPGDVIVAVDGRSVRTVEQLRNRLSQGWDGARLDVVRKGQERELVLRRW